MPVPYQDENAIKKAARDAREHHVRQQLFAELDQCGLLPQEDYTYANYRAIYLYLLDTRNNPDLKYVYKFMTNFFHDRFDHARFIDDFWFPEGKKLRMSFDKEIIFALKKHPVSPQESDRLFTKLAKNIIV